MNRRFELDPKIDMETTYKYQFECSPKLAALYASSWILKLRSPSSHNDSPPDGLMFEPTEFEPTEFVGTSITESSLQGLPQTSGTLQIAAAIATTSLKVETSLETS